MDAFWNVEATTSMPIEEDKDNKDNVLIWIPTLLLCFVAVPVNAFVLFVLIYSRLVLSRQNAFVVLQVLCDLCRCFLTLTSVLTSMTDTATAKHGDYCGMMGFLQSLASGVNCLVVALLLYDRIIFMSSPINYLHRMTRRAFTGLVSYALFHALLPAALPLMGFGHFRFDHHYVTCDVDWSEPVYPQFALIWSTCIPLFVSAVGFIKVYLLVRRRARQIRVYGNLHNTLQPLGVHSCIDRGSTTDMDMSFLRTRRILTVMAIFYYVSWLSHVALSVGLMAGNASLAGYGLGRFISFITCVVNPFLYGIYNRKFRSTLKTIATCGEISETDIVDITPYPCRSISVLALHNYSLEAGPPVPRPKVWGPSDTFDSSTFSASSTRDIDQRPVRVPAPRSVWN